MAQLFLFSPGESIVEGFSNSMFWAISFTTAFLIAGGSLLNSFYDLEKDITQRPFRTILERPVARKYGIRLAVWFYFFAMITAWLNLESLISILFSIYGILLWLYSHKSWNTNVLGPLIALKHFNGAKSWSFVITAESIGLIVGSVIALKIKLKYRLKLY